jgi:biotin synthase
MSDVDGLDDLLARAAERPRALARPELAALLSVEDESGIQSIFDAAYALKVKYCGKRVAMRGIVEAGNVCAKDCYYCGIRKSNDNLQRYQLSADEIVRLAELDAKQDYASLVIQSGEIESEAHTRFIEDVLRRIAPLDLGVTLSLGEQTEEVYRRWKEAGAARYLLRIETSNPDLYATLHPSGHSWERRVECLRALQRCGYQVGTGVMCGLPGQTYDDLARDISFYAEMDVDMIGMGPFIPHPDTPLGTGNQPFATNHQALTLGLKMIAVTRLHLHDVNIAAATALQALAPDGRERGIRAGANVIMPNITDTKYRRSYQLYAGKPCLDENAGLCKGCLEMRLAAIGETIDYGRRGDSLHYRRRTSGSASLPKEDA